MKEKNIYDDSVQPISDGSVSLDYGPMRLWIWVSEGGRTLTQLAIEGAQFAKGILEDLAKFLPILKKKSLGLVDREFYPEVVRKMIVATQKIGEKDLTPLAAVAGTVSDMVADFIFTRGGNKIIVDNGGDIAIRLREKEVAKVGIKTEIEARQPTYLLSIDATMQIGGVATSGLGGRSFTKGIAQAATAIAETASWADAAATTIGNFTNIEDSNILRIPAETIYPDTDIAGEWVTVQVGKLSQEKIEEALKRGLSKATQLCQKDIIKGAFISVQGNVVWTEGLGPLLKKL